MAVKPQPGETVREVKETQVLPTNAASTRKWPENSEFWNFFENQFTPEKWRDHDCQITIYRGGKGEKGPLCEQLYAEDLVQHPFNRRWLQRTYGGGKYRFMVKLDGQLSFDYVDEFVGDPHDPDKARASSSIGSVPAGASSELTFLAQMFMNSQRELIQELRNARGSDVVNDAVRQAISLNGQVFSGAVPAITGAMANASGGGAAAPARDPLMDQLMNAAIAKLLNPSDPIETFGKMFVAMKSFMEGNGGSAGGSGETWAQTLVRALPQVLSNLAPNLQAMEKMRQQELDVARMRMGSVPVQPPQPQALPPAATAPPPPAAPPAAPQEQGTSLIETIQVGLVHILSRDVPVDDAADNALFLLDLYAGEMMTQLAQNPNAEEELLNLFRTQPILVNNVPQNPRLTEFIKKLVQKLRDSRGMNSSAPATDPGEDPKNPPASGPYATAEQPSA